MDQGYLLTGLLFSSIGFGYFIYGRKQKNKSALYSGLGLMLYPYAISSVLWLVIIGLLLMAFPFVVDLDDLF